ncbi:MAG: hypothetical protein A4E35_00784 [Methanoregula sp. PtaU1.Bin051]|nr:MAG: hypothetical protein A4E35_00784 [Methanoregula sp. PtaU1.Bin051]
MFISLWECRANPVLSEKDDFKDIDKFRCFPTITSQKCRQQGICDLIRAEGYYSASRYPFLVKTVMVHVDDTEENSAICRKYCMSCPTFRVNRLADLPPNELFCARGISSSPSPVKTAGCYCPACEVFMKYHLKIGYFCAKR